MKKICIAYIFLLWAVACQHQELVPDEKVPASGPDFSAMSEGFTAETRTVLADDLSSAWTSGDRIAVFAGNSLADEYLVDDACDGATEALFHIDASRAEGGSTLSSNLAIYPYQDGLNASISTVGEGGVSAYRIDGFSFPAVQYYQEGSFGEDSYAMAAITSGTDDYSLEFRNLGGALKLQLIGTALVKSLTLTGNDSEKIAGSARVYVYASGDEPSVVMATDALTSIVLDCGSGVQLNETEPTVFMFSLPPTSFESGFTVAVEDIDGRSGTLSASASNTVGRSKILKMPVAAAVIAQPLENRSYVDEYGVNRGRGVEIDGVVWAPVNCGYRGSSSSDRGYPYGKLYQWGRQYGHGFSLSYDASVASMVTGGSVTVADGNAEANSGVFYTRTDGNNLSNWFSDTEFSGVWDGGSSAAPVKSEYDPCPDGWRVPTAAEMRSLIANKSAWTAIGSQNGYWFSGSTAYASGVDAVFFPAAGWLHQTGIGQSRGSIGRYLTSTVSSSATINQLTINNSNSVVTLNGTVYGCSVRCVADAGYVGDTESGVVDIESIILNYTELSLYEGDVLQLHAELQPVEASPEFVVWTSSDESVAYVDQTGCIYAYAIGEAVITVSSGSVSASCVVSVSEFLGDLYDYEDEYGFNHGPGVRIDGIVWAPVNCGYLAPTDEDKGYPYGKVYQWGRRDGFGLSSNYDSTVPELMNGPADFEDIEELASFNYVAYWWWYAEEGMDYTDYSNTFVKAAASEDDWFALPDWDGDEYIERGYFWNWGSSEEPEKSDLDPCPDGWRLPTFREMEMLSEYYSSVSFVDGQRGFWFSGSTPYSDDADAIFLPSGGFLNHMGQPVMRTQCGRYWCSDYSPSENICSLYFIGYESSQTGEYVESLSLGGCGAVLGCSVRCVQE